MRKSFENLVSKKALSVMLIRTIVKKKTEVEDRLYASVLIIKLLAEENAKLKTEVENLKNYAVYCKDCDSYRNEYLCESCFGRFCLNCWKDPCQNENQ